MKRRLRLLRIKGSKKGQATTELAIIGTLVIMALAYLIQYGYVYNNRQALEMYAFRKALELSKQYERGITLTVMRDVILPSFFTGVSRQRLMATASVEYNPYKLYTPYQEDPEDVGTWQLVQLNDGMIRKNYFLQIPPTLITTRNETGDNIAMWYNSAIAEFDSQAQLEKKSSAYEYTTSVSEAGQVYTIVKQLKSTDTIPTKVVFDNATNIADAMLRDDWDNNYHGYVSVHASTIPKDVNMILDEEVTKGKNVVTTRY